MRAKEGVLHLIYSWLVVGLAIWQLDLLFPVLDMDKGRELLAIIFLGVLAEWLAVAFPHGQLSASFALVLSTFLIYGPAAAAWVNGLATLFGQGIVNRGNPMRTTLFNAGQYVLAVVAADYIFHWSTAITGPAGFGYFLAVVLFTAVYIFVNHLLVYFYLLPQRRRLPHSAWLDTLKWDGMTYLFTVPLGLLIAGIYGYVGLTGILLLFFSLLALQLILRFHVRLQVTNRELTAFYEVARFLEVNHRPEKVMEHLLKSTARAFTYHTGVVYLNAGDKDTYLPVAVVGPYSKQIRSTAVYPGEGIIGSSLLNKETAIVFDSRTDPLTRSEVGLGQVLRSLIVVPLLSGKEAQGVVVLGDKRPMAFDEKHLHIMAVLGAQASMALENAVLNRRLEQVLSRDTLTGLFNFHYFSEELSRACESAVETNSPVGIILIDIDRFKKFNLRYGRQAGEQVLSELAALINGDIRRDDLAVRYGGDEFALLLPGAGGLRLRDKAETLWQEIREHHFLKEEGRAARISVSIGIAEYPRDANAPAGLLRAAQFALDKAKVGGGDRVDAAAAPQ